MKITKREIIASVVIIGLMLSIGFIISESIQQRLLEKYQMYEFKKNKGYGTKAHIEDIEKYGVLEEHRKSFRPIRKD